MRIVNCLSTKLNLGNTSIFDNLTIPSLSILCFSTILSEYAHDTKDIKSTVKKVRNLLFDAIFIFKKVEMILTPFEH